jgi:hypothetical protein
MQDEELKERSLKARQERDEVYQRQYEEGVLSRKELEGDILRYRRLVHTPDPNKQYVNVDQGSTAYCKILDAGITAEEALQYVAEVYRKDDDWVKEVKHNNYFHAKYVTDQFDSHPVQKEMLSEGTMDKKPLRDAKTVNNHLNTLHKQRKVHKRLKDLEQQLDDTTVSTVLNATDITTIAKGLGVSLSSQQEQAKALKANGRFTQKQISEHLNIPLRTLKRWWKDL